MRHPGPLIAALRWYTGRDERTRVALDCLYLELAGITLLAGHPHAPPGYSTAVFTTGLTLMLAAGGSLCYGLWDIERRESGGGSDASRAGAHS